MIKHTITAFYGGTFDPIHYGHLRSTMVLAHLINLQKIIFLPNNTPPHKLNLLTTPQQRLEMLQLAIVSTSNNLFTIDTRELKKDKFSWTIHTFEELRYEYGHIAPLAFIIGQDSLLTLPLWYRSQELLSLCHILVCARSTFYANYIKNIKTPWIISRIIFDPNMLYTKPAGFIYCADTPNIDISSSKIRKYCRQGISYKEFLPNLVYDYINKRKIYY